MTSVRIAAAQTPELRGGIAEALNYLVTVVDRAALAGAKLVCFPEAFLQGYLLDEPSARVAALDLSQGLAPLLQSFPNEGPTVVFGVIELEGDRLYNTAVVTRGRTLAGRYRKAHLLAGERIFSPGTDCPIFEADSLRFGINICNDTNFPQAATKIANGGATLIVCPTNNMMPRQKAIEFKEVHNAVRGQRCRETGLWLVSADVTGERDGRVAWGPTAVLNPSGQVMAQLPLGQPGLLFFDLPFCATYPV